MGFIKVGVGITHHLGLFKLLNSGYNYVNAHCSAVKISVKFYLRGHFSRRKERDAHFYFYFYFFDPWYVLSHDVSHNGTMRETMKKKINTENFLKPNKQIIVITSVSLWLTTERQRRLKLSQSDRAVIKDS